MPCSVAGHTQPSAVLHLSGSAGPPQERTSLPFESNSMTDGAGRQQSPSAPYGRGKPSTSTGFPSLDLWVAPVSAASRSEEHTSELQSRLHLVCRLLLEKK